MSWIFLKFPFKVFYKTLTQKKLIKNNKYLLWTNRDVFLKNKQKCQRKKIKKVIDIKQYLSFNFYGSFNGVFKVGHLIVNLFTHFKLFEHFGFDGNFSQTFFVCFSGVFLTVKLEGYLFGFESLWTIFQSGFKDKLFGGFFHVDLCEL